MPNLLIHKKILIVPLDWGLGHATRCIPLIKVLQQLGHEIIIASLGEPLVLLKKEFPDISFIPLRGYNMNYTKNKRWLLLKILLQMPKILLRIKRERQWLGKIISKWGINMVISDNRFGVYTKKVPCIFITHQLRIKAPYEWLEYLIQKVNYSYINSYTECWVPDLKDDFNIAGDLSHPSKLPSVPVRYISSLSRFSLKENTEKKFIYLFMLSGPEPQRTILEEKILKVALGLTGKVMILRGKPGEENIDESGNNVKILNHLDTAKLEETINASEYIISRSGYTTIMEVLSLKKKTILIPTPGQTEQEYLAKHLMQQNWCYACNQNDDLLYHINKAKDFEFKLPGLTASALPKVVEDFLNKYR